MTPEREGAVGQDPQQDLEPDLEQEQEDTQEVGSSRLGSRFTHAVVIDEYLLRYFPVFTTVGILVVFVGLLPYPRTRGHEVMIVGGIFICLTLSGWALKWKRAPSWMWVVAPLLYLLDIAVLRDAQGGGGSGLAAVFILPVIWIAFYGRRIHVVIGLATLAAVLIIPILAIGGVVYPESEWRIVLVVLGVSTAVAYLIFATVARERAHADDIARHAAEIKDVAEQAETARERLAALLRAATRTAIIGSNRHGVVTYFSAGAEQMFGTVAEAVVGHKTIFDFFDRDEINHRGPTLLIDLDLAEVDPDPRTSDVEGVGEDPIWTFVRPDGTRGRMSVVVTNDVSDGRTVGHVVVASDVTEHELLAAERGRLLAIDHEITQVLVEQNAQLRELTRMKDEIVSTVSHEVRTPLTSIRGYIELIMENVPEEFSEDQVRMLRTIERNAEQLLEVADDLLADPALGRDLRVSFGEVDLGTVARDARDVIAASSGDRGQSLEVSAEGSTLVRGDPARLHQLFINLLSNAVKFAPIGGRIKVKITSLGPFARIEVSDNGPGIPAEERPHLFERFYRVASSERLGIPGTGLGLAIAKSIVDAHNGTIHVVDSPGWATTFRVHLPAMDQNRPTAIPESPPLGRPGDHDSTDDPGFLSPSQHGRTRPFPVPHG